MPYRGIFSPVLIVFCRWLRQIGKERICGALSRIIFLITQTLMAFPCNPGGFFSLTHYRTTRHHAGDTLKHSCAFLASFLLLCRYTRCQIRAQSSLINLRLSFDRSRWYFLTTGAHENARREPSSAPSDMLGIKNPCAAQPALHKIPLCGEYCLIKNPRSSSRKTRVCSHAPDAHTPRKTNFLLISFLNQVVMF